MINTIIEILGIDDRDFCEGKAEKIYKQLIKPLEDTIKEKNKVILQKEREIDDNEKVYKKYRELYKDNLERHARLSLDLEKENYELKKKLQERKNERLDRK